MALSDPLEEPGGLSDPFEELGIPAISYRGAK